jgi:hypothetical protein
LKADLTLETEKIIQLKCSPISSQAPAGDSASGKATSDCCSCLRTSEFPPQIVRQTRQLCVGQPRVKRFNDELALLPLRFARQSQFFSAHQLAEERPEMFFFSKADGHVAS